MAAPRADFDAIYRHEYAALVHVAWALSGDRAVAEDLVQEAFLRAHDRWDRISSFDRPGAWVRRVVINLSTSRSRRLRSEARAFGRLTLQRGPASEDAEAHEFWAAVRRLPRRQAQVIALHYIEDRSVEDIAEILQIAAGTVRATLHQARRTLAVALDEEEHE